MRSSDKMMGGTGNNKYPPLLSNPIHKSGHLATRLIDYATAREL